MFWKSGIDGNFKRVSLRVSFSDCGNLVSRTKIAAVAEERSDCGNLVGRTKIAAVAALLRNDTQLPFRSVFDFQNTF